MTPNAETTVPGQDKSVAWYMQSCAVFYNNEAVLRYSFMPISPVKNTVSIEARRRL